MLRQSKTNTVGLFSRLLCLPLSGKIFHQEERVFEVQREDADRRLLTFRGHQAALIAVSG